LFQAWLLLIFSSCEFSFVEISETLSSIFLIPFDNSSENSFFISSFSFEVFSSILLVLPECFEIAYIDNPIEVAARAAVAIASFLSLLLLLLFFSVVGK
jgi:hypothetical protein